MEISSEGVYRPNIDHSKCKKCGLCNRVCPNTLSVPSLPSIGLGKIIQCYTGYSTDRELRFKASSGGIATSLLASLFNDGAISGAIVLRTDSENPLNPQMVLVKSPDELTAAMGSRYCPVKPNYKLADLVNEKGPIAVVGLPCHIWAFNRFEQSDKRLKGKFIKIGLLCGKCPNSFATEFFIKQKAIKKDEAVRLTYRGDGWPGKFSVQNRQGSRYTFEMSEWCSFSYFPHFIPIRCALCTDISNQKADLTIGDAWGLTQDVIGTSIIISRTDLGERIVQDVRNKGHIYLQPVSSRELANGQGIERKVRNTLIRALFWEKIFKQPLPMVTVKVERIAKKEWVQNLFYCTILYFSRNAYFRVVMCHATVNLKKLIRR